MKTPTFKRSKNNWTEEEKALTDVIAKQGIESQNLKPAHTETHFVWEVVTATNKDTYVVAMNEVQSKAEAVEQAKVYFNTFEGNLKGHHTETEYIFTKVRG